MELTGILRKKARAGSERAAEFLLKTQHGFKETAVHQMMDLDLSDMTEEELAVMEKALKKKMGV
jgi:hypothetical protein